MLAGKIIIIHDFQSVYHNLLASLCGVFEGIFNGDEVIAGRNFRSVYFSLKEK